MSETETKGCYKYTETSLNHQHWIWSTKELDGTTTCLYIQAVHLLAQPGFNLVSKIAKTRERLQIFEESILFHREGDLGKRELFSVRTNTLSVARDLWDSNATAW